MKRDNKMAILMADHVISLIREKREQENRQLEVGGQEKMKDHPVKDAIQSFFNNNLKAFGCERENVIKLMSALTGFTYDAVSRGGEYFAQYSVITSNINYNGSYLTVPKGAVLLVGTNNGRIFTFANTYPTLNYSVGFHLTDARRATTEEYIAFMSELDTEKGKQKLATWMAHNGIADCCFGLKLDS